MRWTFNAEHAGLAAKRALQRFGVKAGIVVAGAIVAAGTVHRATYLPRTHLVQRIVASAPVNVKTPWGTSAAAASSVAPGGLDAGVDHDRIAYWVQRLSTTLRSDFAQTLERKSKYTEMISAKLDAKQMPRDLIYLAMIESEFNPNAKSPVHAVGLWQFMSGTARRFGLTVRGHVDERKDPAKATDAAVAYLSDLHDRFGSWYLAAAAYNSGEGTVLRALKSVTGKSVGTDDDFFRILPALPRETQDYVPKLIAAARVGNSLERDSAVVREPAVAAEVNVPPVVAATKPLVAKSHVAKSHVAKSHVARKAPRGVKKSAPKKKAKHAVVKTKPKAANRSRKR